MNCPSCHRARFYCVCGTPWLFRWVLPLLVGCGGPFTYDPSMVPSDAGADVLTQETADADGGAGKDDAAGNHDAALVDSSSDGGVSSGCCELNVFDSGALLVCSPYNRFSCDISGDGGGWMGCTEALDQGTPCLLGMACHDEAFKGTVVPCQ